MKSRSHRWRLAYRHARRAERADDGGSDGPRSAAAGPAVAGSVTWVIGCTDLREAKRSLLESTGMRLSDYIIVGGAFMPFETDHHHEQGAATLMQVDDEFIRHVDDFGQIGQRVVGF
ncbi:hypothetical protein [Amycolatopsis sp. CA-126428]|uniref:hypothetical protein n=1 Tax=Amycolatopsis sp. CA-126428 TaxID=2073158 RepID=UPI0011B05D06|nr:hypothetical protein [Amycolatopsis sp. CA-126428]